MTALISYRFDTLLDVLISLTLAAISLTAALHALLRKRDSTVALAWVAFCLVLPLFGPLIYLIFGVNRVAERARRTYLARSPVDTGEPASSPANSHLEPMSRVGKSVTGAGLCSCDQVQMLENGEALYPAMLADIATATKKVYCSTYIFQDDEIGNRFVTALAAAADRNVDVKIIIDGLGGLGLTSRIDRKLGARGLNWQHFNPIRLIPPSLHVNMRNHRKILVVDGRIGYTGGHNIGDHHLVNKSGNRKRTRDLHFRFTGKIVDELERTFLKDWDHCSGATGPATFRPANVNRTESAVWTRQLLDGPGENLDKLNELLVGVLALAQRRIWIMTPYFLPGPDIFGALLGARLRGVDVKIVLPERINVPMAHWATQHTLHHLLARELAVYLQPAPFVHTKAILIDEDYTLVGSANLDPRSLRLNFELVVEIFDPVLAGAMDSYFSARLAEATVLSDPMLRSLPAWVRIRNAIAWLFTPYL